MTIPPEEKKPDIFNYAKTNPRDTVAYVLLIVGIILLFSGDYYFWGGVLIGLVLGFYFGHEFTELFKHANEVSERLGLLKLLILAALFLTFFVAAPGVFIGTAIALAVKQLAFHDERPNTPTRKL